MKVTKCLTSITRKNLTNRNYVPEAITMISQDSIDGYDQKRYYQPTINVLKKIYDDKNNNEVNY